MFLSDQSVKEIDGVPILDCLRIRRSGKGLFAEPTAGNSANLRKR